MKPLNVAVISVGGAGRAHIGRFNRSGKSCVRAILDPKEKNLRDFLWIKEKGGYVTTDYEKILNDEEIDVISICSPDHTHFDYAMRAIKAGKHVLVEKPMVTSLEQCKKLQAAISNSDKIFGAHHQMRYVPCFMRARNSVINGEIGLPYIIEADYSHDMHERATSYDNWRIDCENPQKIVLGASSHTIDLIRWILDDEVVEVFSYASHIGWPEYPDEDTVMTILKFSRGAIGKVLSTIACARPQLNSLAIYGTGGSINNNLLIGKSGLDKVIHLPKYRSIRKNVLAAVIGSVLKRTSYVQNWPFSVYEHENACKVLIDHFLSCAQKNLEFPVNFSEGAYTVQICAASIQSYHEGQPVQVKRLF